MNWVPPGNGFTGKVFVYVPTPVKVIVIGLSEAPQPTATLTAVPPRSAFATATIPPDGPPKK